MDETKNVVVYTAVFDDYDVVLDPQPIEKSVDYICFTDNPGAIPEAWETRQVSFPHLSPKLKSGKVKCHPHEFLSEYEKSVWVDANIAIIGKMSSLYSSVLEDVNLGVPAHRSRDCLYEEAEVCVEHGIADPEVTRNQMDRYRKAGFPSNFGLSETRVLVRNHMRPEIKEAMELWWEEYRSGAERDQLSFEYAMWESGVPYHQLPPDITVDSQFFKYYPHKVDIVGNQLYDALLRGRWNANSTGEYFLSRLILPIYLSIMPAARAARVFRNKGAKEVIKRFNNRYLQ